MVKPENVFIFLLSLFDLCVLCGSLRIAANFKFHLDRINFHNYDVSLRYAKVQAYIRRCYFYMRYKE